MDETLAVARLSLPPELRRALATANGIELGLSVTRLVTRWRERATRQSNCTAGHLGVESKHRRVKSSPRRTNHS